MSYKLIFFQRRRWRFMLLITSFTLFWGMFFVLQWKNSSIAARHIETVTFIRIGLAVLMEDQVRVEADTVCPLKWKKMDVGRDSVDPNGFQEYGANSRETALLAARKGHLFFLPVLNMDMKQDYLHLYSVFSAALKQADIEFFLVEKSLLGLIRHGGFIPWDPAFEVSVDAKKTAELNKALSCFRNFTLSKEESWKWRFLFRHDSLGFAIDIWFHRRENDFTWSLSRRTFSAFVYPSQHVFPVSEQKFEGVTVPVPYDSMWIVRSMFSLDSCVVRKTRDFWQHFDLLATFPPENHVETAQCKDLLYLYKMQL